MEERGKMLKELANAYDRLASMHESLAYDACNRHDPYSVYFNVKQATAFRTLITKIERNYTQF